MQCDNCHIHIEEDDTYERILCGHCHRHEELPPDVYCAHCAVKLSWTKTIDTLKKIGYHLRWMKYPAWVAFFLVVAAFEWRNLMYAQVLLGIGAVLVGIVALAIAIILAFPCVYILGWFVGEKLFKWNMPDIGDGPAGIFTWLFGVLTLSSPVLIWLLGLLFRLIGRHVTG